MELIFFFQVPKVTFSKQYRMVPEIGNLVKGPLYPILEHSETVKILFV
jgi:hypothetical protein